MPLDKKHRVPQTKVSLTQETKRIHFFDYILYSLHHITYKYIMQHLNGFFVIYSSFSQSVSACAHTGNATEIVGNIPWAIALFDTQLVVLVQDMKFFGCCHFKV